jgi:hypothetical protein
MPNSSRLAVLVAKPTPTSCSPGTTPDGQAIGNGCVYPTSIRTLPDQLNAAGKTWRGYMEDMGNDPNREAATCGHPARNSRDLTQSPEVPSASVPLGDQYAWRHNPFVYFTPSSTHRIAPRMW